MVGAPSEFGDYLTDSARDAGLVEEVTLSNRFPLSVP